MTAAFRLLGDLEVRDGGGVAVELGPPQRRSVLAVLLVDLGHTVATDTLLDRVWGVDAGPGARSSLYAHICRLRAVLTRAGLAPEALDRQAGGYRLDLDPSLVDLHRFRALVRRAIGGPQRAPHAGTTLATLDEALDLWRGEALAGVSGSWADAVRADLDRELVDAHLAWAGPALRTGRAAEVAAALGPLAVRHPSLEPLAAARMRALALVGRPAEALACYNALWHRLAEELGTGPGPEVTAVHEEIRAGTVNVADPEPAEWPSSVDVDAAVDGRAHPAGGRTATHPPAQLPPRASAFTGRAAELAALDAALDPTGGGAPGPCLLTGTAGVGKTALAVHWGHLNAAAFPDGQLFTDLRGYDPEHPADPQAVLAGFLRALGLDDAHVPVDPAERVARYRAETAGRRLLVVLDNACDPEGVEPLLPDAACAVLITSRDALPDLVDRHHANRMEIGLLPSGDAAALLVSLVGGQVRGEDAALQAVVERCARLPLALRVAAERAASRPGTRLTEVAAELADEKARLDVLGVPGDPRTTVASVFSWSYRQLTDRAARTFRLLGLHPGPDADRDTVAALVGLSPEAATADLEELTRVHLTQLSPTGRVSAHDLLRDYARRLARTSDPADEQRAAMSRYLDHRVVAVTAAADRLHALLIDRRAPLPTVAVPPPALVDAAAARCWLDAERTALVRAVVHAADHGWPEHSVRLADGLWRYLYDGNHTSEGSTVFAAAARAARAIGDRSGEAAALVNSSSMLWHAGRLAEAEDELRRADALVRDGDDLEIAARVRTNLGLAVWHAGRYPEGEAHLECAIDLWERADNQAGLALALSNLASCRQSRGNVAGAEEMLRRAVDVATRNGARRAEAEAHDALGELYQDSGLTDRAATEFGRALEIWHEVGGVIDRSVTLTRLGGLLAGHGDPGRAVELLTEALGLLVAAGNRALRAAAVNGLGVARLALGDPRAAAGHHRHALALAQACGSAPDQAAAHRGLSAVALATGDDAAARRHEELAGDLEDRDEVDGTGG